MLELAFYSKSGLQKKSRFTDFELLFFLSPRQYRYQTLTYFQKLSNLIKGRLAYKKTFCLRPKPYSGNHQSFLNLDCEKIDRENKTLQEVKSKSIKDETKNNDSQKLNAKTETDVVKV